jgi:hypothetical protein
VNRKKIWVFDSGKEAVIPDGEIREQLIYDCHVNLSHRCITTVYYELRKTYYWPGIKDQIYEAIKRCEVCQKYNRKCWILGRWPLFCPEAC